MKSIRLIMGVLVLLAMTGCAEKSSPPPDRKGAAMQPAPKNNPPTAKSDEDWRKLLTPEQFNVLREKGTENPFSGAYWNHHEKGIYRCAACGAELFQSDTKFDSGCGWPSFYAPLLKGNVRFISDNTHGMERTEVVCAACGGHLGHVFDDGPPPTHQRFCINSVSLKFEKRP